LFTLYVFQKEELSAQTFNWDMCSQGILKGDIYHCTVDLLFDWFRLVCFANKNKIVSCHTADSKPVKKEVNGTVILPPLVFPGETT
jgi:hypothetical protein